MRLALSGVGNTPAHQYLITYFLIGIYNRFAKNKKYENYRVYPELNTENGKNPDLSVYIRKRTTNELIVVVEFCTNKTFDDDCDKVMKLLKSIGTIKEGYVFNSDTFLMYRIDKGTDKAPVKKKVLTDTIGAINFKIDKAVARAKADLIPPA